jgi:hypothetical protein
MYKLKLSRKEKKELALSKWLLIGLALLGIFVVVWLAWIRPAQHEANIDSFDTCKAAGNAIQESYPEVCLTKDGKRFVNPTQQKAHNEHIEGQDKLVPPTDSAKLYLTIDEWGVRVPLTTETFDLIYTYIDDGGPVRSTFTFRRLLQADFCKSDAGVTMTRSNFKSQPPYSATNPEPAAKVGEYYYYVAYAGSPCYDPENTGQVALVKQIAGEQSLTQAIGELLKKLEAEPAS